MQREWKRSNCRNEGDTLAQQAGEISLSWFSAYPQSSQGCCSEPVWRWQFFSDTVFISALPYTHLALVCVQNIKHNHQLSFDCLFFPVLQGYLFISVLVNSNSELIRLINNAIKNDLSSRNPTFMCLALHCIANVGSREMAEAFAGEIPRILVAGWATLVWKDWVRGQKLGI